MTNNLPIPTQAGLCTGIFKLTFYVPNSHIDTVKNAVFAAGAGKIGNYACCCWQVLGDGQFMPLSGANPFIGQQATLAVVPEWRVEILVPEADLGQVVHALRQAHPYETPAFDVVAVWI